MPSDNDNEPSIFDVENTTKILERLGVQSGTRGELLVEDMIKGSVEFLVYVLARLLYPDYHYLVVLKNEDNKFVHIKELVMGRFEDVDKIVKEAFIKLGRLGDEIVGGVEELDKTLSDANKQEDK